MSRETLASIRGHQWEHTIASADLDSAASNWTKTFLQLCKDSIPNRDIRVRPQDVPWMTHEWKCAIRDCNRLYERFKRTRDINHEAIWRTKVKEVRLIINLSKLRYKQKLMDTLSDPNLSSRYVPYVPMI